MDEFKRVYSNEDTLTVAIPYFWDKFDKENYSIWYCEYQEDLSKFITFMSCNLVSGECWAFSQSASYFIRGFFFLFFLK